MVRLVFHNQVAVDNKVPLSSEITTGVASEKFRGGVCASPTTQWGLKVCVGRTRDSYAFSQVVSTDTQWKAESPTSLGSNKNPSLSGTQGGHVENTHLPHLAVTPVQVQKLAKQETYVRFKA